MARFNASATIRLSSLLVMIVAGLALGPLVYGGETQATGGIDCRRLLICEDDIVAADDCLQAELAVDPTDPIALLFRSMTRVLRVAEENVDGPLPGFTDSLKEMLDQFGYPAEGRSVYDFTAQAPATLPTDSPTGGDVREFLATVLAPAIDASIADLQSIDESTSFFLTEEELACSMLFTPVEIDFGEVKLLESGLHLLNATLHSFWLAYDLDVDIDGLSVISPLRIQQDVFDAYPNLLGVGPDGASQLQTAENALKQAIEIYYDASDYMRNNDDLDQGDDLITILPEDVATELELRESLAEIYCSLDGRPVRMFQDAGITCARSGIPRISGNAWDLSRFFDPPGLDLRGALPTFGYDDSCAADFVDLSNGCPFPDPTLGGLLPEMTCQQLILDTDLSRSLLVNGFFRCCDDYYPYGFYGEVDVYLTGLLAKPAQITDVHLTSGALFEVKLILPSEVYPPPEIDIDQVEFPLRVCDAVPLQYGFPNAPPEYSLRVGYVGPLDQNAHDRLVIETDEASQSHIVFDFRRCVGSSLDCDDDGIADGDDNCTFVANFTQEDLDADSVGDVCDNCPDVRNPGQSDSDADSEGDLCDLDDGTIFVIQPGSQRLDWQDEAGFDSWNLYRGDLSVLAATGVYTQPSGSNDLAARHCGLTSPTFEDPTVPAPGTTAFFLVTGTNGSEGGLGANSAGVERTNTNPCPMTAADRSPRSR